MTSLNITSVKELHELFKELLSIYPLIQGNETAQAQLLQLLKHGKGFNDWLNTGTAVRSRGKFMAYARSR